MNRDDRLFSLLRFVVIFFCLTQLLVGCGSRSTVEHRAVIDSEAKSSHPLIAATDREHDFGIVISRTGRNLIHRYRLSNQTSHDITLRNVVNRKTCCGVVTADASKLKPGEVADIAVTLLVLLR